MPKNIFVLGADELNLKILRHTNVANDFQFHTLLTFEEVKGEDDYPFEEALEKAIKQLEEFQGSIDGIIGYWDFPVSSMVPILCRKFNLPGPSLESVLKCEHKYWSRVEQQKSIQEYPQFQAIDPQDEKALDKLELDYPFWFKPIKSTSSQLSFFVENDDDFLEAVSITKKEIVHISEPFNKLLSHADIPEEISKVTGRFCLAEKPITGKQCTVSGYVTHGNIVVYGIIDSVTMENEHQTFLCYRYPSILPKHAQDRLTDVTKKVIHQVGLDHSAFNIEFFYNEEEDSIGLLEINPRISQSHGYIYEQVDGQPNHKVIIDLAIGQDPSFPYRKGKYKYAGKFFVRKFEDATVIKVPNKDEIRQLEAQYPGCEIDLKVAENIRLSKDLLEQASYSFELADLFIAGDSPEELEQKYEEIKESLHFEFKDEAKLTASLH